MKGGYHMSNKKGSLLSLAAMAAAGAGAAMLMKKTKEVNHEEAVHVKETTENYRNTERGRYEKNSKGIFIVMFHNKFVNLL